METGYAIYFQISLRIHPLVILPGRLWVKLIFKYSTGFDFWYNCIGASADPSPVKLVKTIKEKKIVSLEMTLRTQRKWRNIYWKNLIFSKSLNLVRVSDVWIMTCSLSTQWNRNPIPDWWSQEHRASPCQHLEACLPVPVAGKTFGQVKLRGGVSWESRESPEKEN